MAVLVIVGVIVMVGVWVGVPVIVGVPVVVEVRVGVVVIAGVGVSVISVGPVFSEVDGLVFMLALVSFPSSFLTQRSVLPGI